MNGAVVAVIPPASPGNLGDFLALKEVHQSLVGSSYQTVLFDLHCDLDSNLQLQSWALYSPWTVIEGHGGCWDFLENSHEPVFLLFLGQDTVDGRFGELHIQRILELLGQSSVSELWVCNATVDPEARLSDPVKNLLSQSQVWVRDRGSLETLHGAEIAAEMMTDSVVLSANHLASGFVSRRKTKGRIGFSLGLCIGPQLLAFEGLHVSARISVLLSNFLSTNYDTSFHLFEGDTRFFENLPRDIDAGRSILESVELVDAVIEHHLEWSPRNLGSLLTSYAEQLLEFDQVITSRQHVAVLCLALGIPVVVLAHNSKFSGLEPSENLHIEWLV